MISEIDKNKDYREKEIKAEAFIRKIQNDPRDFVKYRDGYPIADLRDLIDKTCEKHKDKIAFYQKYKKDEAFTPITYNELKEDMYAFGTALCNMGLKKARIAVIGENSYRWCISYLGVVCGTGVVVPMDKELSKGELKNLMLKAQVSAIITSKKHLNDVIEIKEETGDQIKTVISIDGKKVGGSIDWSDVLAEGRRLLKDGCRDFVDMPLDRDAMSVLLFTSGTTGNPKGVMHSHWTIAYDIMAAPTVLKVNDWDIFFSILPLHHTYENTCTFLMALYKGAAVAFCRGLKYVQKDLMEIRPTMFLGVPAIFENIHKKIWQKVRSTGKEKTLKRLMKFTDRSKKIGLNPGKLFFKSIRKVFGGRMRILICGGAAIDPNVLEDFQTFGINAVQGYGVTETAPLAALNPDTAAVNSSIGVEFPGIALDIFEPDAEGVGEILVKGDNVMLGYYEMPEETAEAIVNGWYHTGDFGYKDEKGYFYITGRKKNIIITKNGKNIYPEEIEYNLNLYPIIAESMVYSDSRKNKQDLIIAATVVIDTEILEEFYGKGTKQEQLQQLVWNCVDEVNREAPSYRKIRKVNVRTTPLEKNTSNKIIRFNEENKKEI